jgi:hypothetical protein
MEARKASFVWKSSAHWLKPGSVKSKVNKVHRIIVIYTPQCGSAELDYKVILVFSGIWFTSSTATRSEYRPTITPQVMYQLLQQLQIARYIFT